MQSLRDALNLLETGRAVFLDSVLRSQYVFWFGSGISRNRFPDLKALLTRILVQLHSQCDPNSSTCPYRAAILEILNMTTVTTVDIRIPPNSWPQIVEILTQLVEKYADVLSVTVRSPAGNALRLYREVVDLIAIYSDATIPPDTEHRFIALLIQEGVISIAVTTNWDGLVEQALANCLSSTGNTDLKVIACGNDFAGVGTSRARLIKIHGCAVLTSGQPARYEEYIVATRLQLQDWSHQPRHQPFRDTLQVLLREYSSVFLGLSGRDWNLQLECARNSIQGFVLPVPPEKLVFCVPTTEQPQRQFLQAMLRTQYDSDSALADAQSTLGMFALPFLGALYIATLISKIRESLLRAQSEVFVDHFAMMLAVLDAFKKMLCDYWDAMFAVSSQATTAWSTFSKDVPHLIDRFVALFREQSLATSKERYFALYPDNLQKLKDDPNIVSLNLHWLFLVLSILYQGAIAGRWSIHLPANDSGQDGHFLIKHGGRGIKVFILNTFDTAPARLKNSGFLPPGPCPDTVIIHPGSFEPASSPTLTPRRRFSAMPPTHWPRELWLRDLASRASTVNDLLDSFEIEFASV